MRTPMSLRVATLLALASSGCYSIVNPDKIKPPQTPSAICAAVYDQFIARSVECFHSPIQWVEATGGSPDCKAYDRAVASGNLEVDPSKLGQCQRDIAATDCVTLFLSPESGAPGACAQLVTGKVPESGSCYLEDDCVSGTYCGGLICPGVCTRYGGSGAACGTLADAACGPGLACIASTCQSYLSLNGDCSANTSACAPGLWCDPGTGRCSSAGVGTSCPGPEGCPVPGLLCAGYDKALSLAGTCQVARGLGTACTVGRRECAYGTYCAGSAILTTGVCTLYPASLNQSVPCGLLMNELVDCTGGYCSFVGAAVVGSCVSYIAPNQTCDTTYPVDASAQCGRRSNGYWCDPLGTCRYFRCTEP